MNYYRGSIQDGKFKMANRKAFEASIEHYPDGKYLVVLYKMTEKTTREWQEYYFAVLGEWCNDFGISKDQLHDEVKTELFPELFEDITSTTNLTNEQWNILFLNLNNFLILKFENK